MSVTFKTISGLARDAGVVSTSDNRRIAMRIGIGLPAAIPGAPCDAGGQWAAAAAAWVRGGPRHVQHGGHGVWSGDVGGGTAAIPALPSGRPKLLFGGLAPADAGCDDVVLLPSDAIGRRVELVTEAVDGLRVCA